MGKHKDIDIENRHAANISLIDEFYDQVNQDRKDKYKLVGKLKSISLCLSQIKDNKSQLEVELLKELNCSIDRILELKYTEEM